MGFFVSLADLYFRVVKMEGEMMMVMEVSGVKWGTDGWQYLTAKWQPGFHFSNYGCRNNSIKKFFPYLGCQNIQTGQKMPLGPLQGKKNTVRKLEEEDEDKNNRV